MQRASQQQPGGRSTGRLAMFLFNALLDHAWFIDFVCNFFFFRNNQAIDHVGTASSSPVGPGPPR